MNTLYTWLGYRDIENMKQEQNAAISSLAIFNKTPFDRIVIFANTWEESWDKYETWLRKRLSTIQRPSDNIKVYRADVTTAIDYPTIIKHTEKWLSKLSEESEHLYINLTSGSPAMTAASILVGKGKSNTFFIQSSKDDNVLEVDIPVDFGKAYVKSAAKNIASIAVAKPQANKVFGNIVANSSVMKATIKKAKRLSTSELPTLILGETGTGKEVLANAIHAGSLRADKPLKIVNCGALPETLVDSILFGHVKGAFTGAEKEHKGLFEQADGGTLFLDEVGELTPETQVKLLRALQQGEITKVGSEQTINVDVRVIAATHRDLMQLVETNKFREDLFYRLAVGIVEIPALRNRLEDISPLTLELIDEINLAASKLPDYKSKNISESAIKFISFQTWPGNIRELWNTLNRAFLWSDKETITDNDIQDALIIRTNIQEIGNISLTLGQQVNISDILDIQRKKYIEAALKATGNNKSKAAKMLNLKSHQVLTNWIKELGLENI
ncbi:sigma-54-dependent Fis family transcriptional regulator [Colwellia sp. MB3u-70]|uniref:sigma-54 interaction domain-containing protein n=1 Tax=unclassified Colwellia TaxID=196834 RepID=UPI0015F76615|nr:MULTISPECIES: sigma-54 dependent transcriptional regulator [unclassified Colwellia]MBA6292849.1 sigma-54-dependent Fis family transcriptional regulator [Colwellia sp. MB3u-8]MBA6308067.1 sigma-54-dependent Fis family transcriptional regulator [Colwellia sp. MB3u-70]